MSAVQGQISGAAKLLARLGAIQNVVFIAVNNELEAGAMAIHSDAVKSIQAHEGLLKVVTRYKPKRDADVSPPGLPPNSDRSTLVKSIKFEIDKATFTAVVGTNLKYGLYLETGTTKMNARPWLFPAFEKNRQGITKAVSTAIVAAIKGSGA